LTIGIRAKLFFISLGLIAICIIVAYSYIRTELEAELLSRARETAVVRAHLLARAVESAADRERSSDAWQSLARELSAVGGGRVRLVEREGNVLADSVRAAGDAREATAHPEVQRLLDGRSTTPFVNAEAGIVHVIVSFRRGDGPGGIVWLSQPLTELGAALGALGRTLTVAAVLALAVAVVMSSVAAELASRTARSLTQVARRMAGGDLSTRSRLTVRDEFGELGRALDELARGLSRSVGELREERDRMSGILAGMQEGVLLLDGGGRIVLVNPALRELLLLGADAAGKTLLEVIRHAELKALLDSARGSSEAVTREIEIGSIKPRRLFVRVAALPGDQGQLFAVFVDVTEMRRLESMRRDFVANVSHELRTPVTAIRSAAETLQSGVPKDPSVLDQFIGIIERNAARLQDLVEDVLDLSRIESRELRLNMEALDLKLVYGQVLALFRERADRRGISLVNEASAELPRARADRRALEHVLTNLIDNAVKYCGSGSSVRLGAAEHGNSVRVFVTDDGPGIEPRHLPRIFERFYRVDAGRSRDLGGTGLGLSIVKHLVEAMDGSVQVESTPGRGTTFSFTLKNATSESVRAVA